MSRPRLFRDPVHLQLRYPRTRDSADLSSSDMCFGWLMQALIDCPEFQRLRHIRQNGLTNLVFHGAEHSRFAHSMGVVHLAGEMYDRICRNCDLPRDEDERLATCVAALLHDIGHGPFSHTLEEILTSLDVEFNHERMTQRIILESQIHDILREVDDTLPDRVVSFIDKKKRKEGGYEEHWSHKIVSSQLDADRLDYLLRDAVGAGLRGHTFDLPRLLDMLAQVHGMRIGVYRGGLETVEGYLVALDQMYRAVYYHHAVRAASEMLRAILTRAIQLYRDQYIPRGAVLDDDHPFIDLVKNGHECNLGNYLRLGEFHVWALIEDWTDSSDQVLSDLARRLMKRRLFKTMEIRPEAEFAGRDQEYIALAQELIVKRLGTHIDDDSVKLYVSVDEPKRTSYKQYDWRADANNESIWILDEDSPRPIQDHPDSKLVSALRDTRYFNRLIFPEEIRADLEEHVKGRIIK